MSSVRYRLAVDTETYSDIELKKTGVHRYVESDQFSVMLVQYARYYDDGTLSPVTVIDLAQGEEPPQDFIDDLFDPAVTKTAYNAAFDRATLAKHFGRPMPPEQWQCTSVLALTLGLPGDLASVSRVLRLPQDKAKMSAGRGLITYFCKPCKPTKANGGRTRNLPHHDPQKWALFKEYGAMDVVAECEVYRKCSIYPLTAFEQRLWEIDQHINDRGIAVDEVLIDNAIEMDAAYKARLLREAVRLTGLDNPNSIKQLVKWLQTEEDDEEITSLTKKTLPTLLASASSETTRQVLRLRTELSKTSVKKYEAMRHARCNDGRVRGLVQFYGANRTGRWAGRLVQVQNLPQNHLADLQLARDLLRSGDYELIELLFASPSKVLSELIRTAFVPSPGVGLFTIVDFAAIEARLLAWLAQEKWRLEVFATHGHIYEASASQMFKVPWSEFQAYIDAKRKHPLRRKGKIAELALGYQGSVGALITMGALEMGLREDELEPIKVAWRRANQAIAGQSYLGERPGLWERCDKAAMHAVQNPKVPFHVEVGPPGGGARVTFFVRHGLLHLTLPSGRSLRYFRPRIETENGRPGVTYEGLDQKTKQWTRIRGYGGKWCENLCQAIGRDCLAEAMVKLWDRDGVKSLVLHVHDEGVFDGADLEQVEGVFGEPIPWAPGLLLRGDGFTHHFYKKDD